MHPEYAHLPARIKNVWLLSISCYWLLLVVFSLATLWLVPQGKQANAVVWGVYIVPLLLFAVGVMRGARRSFAWLGFVSLMYFCVVVTSLFLPTASWLDTLALLLIVTLFITSILYIRWYAAWLKPQDSEQRE